MLPISGFGKDRKQVILDIEISNDNSTCVIEDPGPLMVPKGYKVLMLVFNNWTAPLTISLESFVRQGSSANEDVFENASCRADPNGGVCAKKLKAVEKKQKGWYVYKYTIVAKDGNKTVAELDPEIIIEWDN